MKNGIPISAKKGHGYGCLSIQSIVQQHQGKCHFLLTIKYLSYVLFYHSNKKSDYRLI